MAFNKKAWVRWIREVYIIKRNEQKPCFICHKYELISHAHHLIPVSEMADLLEMIKKDPTEIDKFDVAYVWLCPNHHTLWHLMNSKDTAKGIEAYKHLDENEREAYNHLNKLTEQAWAEFSKFIRGISCNA